MATISISKRYVWCETGEYYVQARDDNQFGFSLYSNDQTFPGGFGVGGEWVVVPAREVPREERERLGWLFRERLGESV